MKHDPVSYAIANGLREHPDIEDTQLHDASNHHALTHNCRVLISIVSDEAAGRCTSHFICEFHSNTLPLIRP